MLLASSGVTDSRSLVRESRSSWKVMRPSPLLSKDENTVSRSFFLFSISIVGGDFVVGGGEGFLDLMRREEERRVKRKRRV